MATNGKTPAELVSEIDQARDQLSNTLNELKASASPAAIARNAGNAVVGVFKNPDGSIRVERVAIVGAVVVGIVGLKLLTRRRS